MRRFSSPRPCTGPCYHLDRPPVTGGPASRLRGFLEPVLTAWIVDAGWPLVPPIDDDTIVACPTRESLIAEEYIRAAVFSLSALPSYRAFQEETRRQFDRLTDPARLGGLGVEVWVTPDDPYSDATAMTTDVLENHRLQVYSTRTGGNPHPWLSDDDNDMFRAVHDVFGHAAAGRGFDRHGEEAAWRKHCQWYSPRARPAVTSETRGQSSVVFAAPSAGFPQQKMTLLPARFSDPRQIATRS